ncbi:moz protein represents a chromatin-associated acetyltransferase [Diplodia corticola]|uniref:Moz protein represents a chromatin-associated acetyltransferase n=1 Tax=Diplodia corticola TaxID=236234 RepID=A0A1J9R7D4_9PEZI|nr:moz protein represents a chromatin-associated acetyltransferase [Diplodia corticola]OJD36496.1 moz protein represents a chromatin-associated acetyltransferase [Diplodia corticola]
MSTPRLTFLYPRFIRPFLISEAGATYPSSSSQAPRAGVKRRSARQGQPACRKATDGGAGARAFGTSAHTRLPPGPMQRYGTANEPLPSPPPGASSDGASGDKAKGVDKAAGDKDGKAAAAAAADGKQDAGAVAGGASKKSASPPSPPPSQEQDKPQHQGAAQDVNAPPKAASPTIFETTSQGEAPNGPPKPSRSAANNGNEVESNPLEAVLRMPPPTSRPVHLTTPRYVHFFDTWSLVKQLTGSGFSEAQSVSLMKAIRAQLNDNVELAHAGLVGKSDVENETYLFRAACSELRTEVGNNRKAENERMSTQRNQLQHEVDILGQRLGQDTSHLKEEVKGMFDDRKMAVRMEQKTMESKIQELNYKITVALNSDARSEVEGLRWIITRRAVTALVVVAVAILATLRFSSYMTHTQAMERMNLTKPAASEKKKEEAQDNKATTSSGGSSKAHGSDAAMGAWAESPAVKAFGVEGAGDGVMISEGGVSLG